MKKLQEIELKIKDESEDGVFAISLVENPAIEEDFVYLSKDEVQLKVIDEDKRIVVGFALVPEKRIYRAMQGKEFNIYFSKETVRRSAELFMKKMNTQNFTLEHEQKVEGISVIESWIVEDPKQDKSNLYNLGAKGGEWVVMSKVYNDAVWQEIKDGKYGGYSIEAMYDGFEQLQSKNVNTNINTMEEKIIEELKMLLSSNEVKLKSVDKFRADYLKIKSGNTAQYMEELIKIKTRVVKGINEVGDYKDKIQNTIKGLASLGLDDEMKDFQFLINDIKNDFDELVFLNEKLKSLGA